MVKKVALLPLIRKFFEADPEQAAHSLEAMSEEEAGQVLTALPPTLFAQIFPHLHLDQAVLLLGKLEPELFAQIVEQLTPHQGVLIFAHLSEEQRSRLLASLPDEKRRQMGELLNYPEDSAGQIMSTDFLIFHADTSVGAAIKKIRFLAKHGSPTTYAYVVDDENRLLGVLNMRDLLLASAEQPLSEVMRKDVFAVDGFMDREEVTDALSKRRFFAAPVVDQENRLLGVVKMEQLIKGVQEEATEDLQKFFGAGGDEEPFSPVRFSLQQRMPWLQVNLFTAFLAASVVGLFEGIIAQITVLAVFLPVVAGQGGNAGAQSLAVVMRGLVMRQIPPDKAWKVILKESWIGTINGVLVGMVVALVAWAWKGNLYLGMVIGLGMVINLIVAGFAGAAIPLTLKKFGRDPAQSANIILTTITDVVGFFAFLGLAVLFRDKLVF